MKVLWVPAVFLKIFAKAEDEIIDGSCGRINIITPYRL
jgi:hypothetical protein